MIDNAYKNCYNYFQNIWNILNCDFAYVHICTLYNKSLHLTYAVQHFKIILNEIYWHLEYFTVTSLQCSRCRSPLRQIATKCLIWQVNERLDSPNCECSVFSLSLSFSALWNDWCRLLCSIALYHLHYTGFRYTDLTAIQFSISQSHSKDYADIVKVPCAKLIGVSLLSINYYICAGIPTVETHKQTYLHQTTNM